MSDQDKKKFANLHYPGIAANPLEGEILLKPEAHWKFEEQIACIGEPAQKHLLQSSVLILSASPLTARLVKG